jgi:hypothetical protein
LILSEKLLSLLDFDIIQYSSNLVYNWPEILKMTPDQFKSNLNSFIVSFRNINDQSNRNELIKLISNYDEFTNIYYDTLFFEDYYREDFYYHLFYEFRDSFHRDWEFRAFIVMKKFCDVYWNDYDSVFCNPEQELIINSVGSTKKMTFFEAISKSNEIVNCDHIDKYMMKLTKMSSLIDRIPELEKVDNYMLSLIEYSKRTIKLKCIYGGYCKIDKFSEERKEILGHIKIPRTLNRHIKEVLDQLNCCYIIYVAFPIDEDFFLVECQKYMDTNIRADYLNKINGCNMFTLRDIISLNNNRIVLRTAITVLALSSDKRG